MFFGGKWAALSNCIMYYFNFSIKNIPTPSKNDYLKNMMLKLEWILRKIRWKAYFFEKLNEIDDATTVNSFGFKSDLTPPRNEYLNAFEEEIYDPVRNIEFKRANTAFQN